MTVQTISQSGARTGFAGTSTQPAKARAESEGKGFQALYQDLARVQANQSGAVAGASSSKAATGIKTENLRYIQSLHENVDSLRGEILARVIKTAQSARTSPAGDVQKATDDISRMSLKLETMRQKLQDEQNRLSGTLVNITV